MNLFYTIVGGNRDESVKRLLLWVKNPFFFPFSGTELRRVQRPVGIFAEFPNKRLAQSPAFLQMDVTGAVAGSAADGRAVEMLRGRVKIDVVKDLLGTLAVKFGFAVDNVEPVFKIGEGIGWHKGVFGTVCTVIVDRTTPRIQNAVVRDGMTRAGADTVAATVAEMGLD